MPPPTKPSSLPPSHPAHRQRPKSPTRVLAETEAQWLFTPAELANTPSIQDGMPLPEERDTRSKGVNFIVQVGIMLKLPQLTLSTAAIFFQRFLMRASLKKSREGIPKLHHYQSAATALFLATKVEESGRKMRELIVAFCRVAQKNPNLVVDEQSKDWWRWRDCILHNEDVLLEVLCFDLTVESPHRQLFEMLKFYGVEHHKRLRNAAWAFVTDSHNTLLCLLCTSRAIAVASLYAACRYTDVALPDDAKGRPWWEGQHVRLKDVRKAVEHMCAHYEGSAGGKGNGVAAAPSAGGSQEGGERSIYAGLSTPAATGLDGSVDDGWDSTRLRDGGAVQEAVGVQGSPYLVPAGSERRASNASSVGLKREREEDEKPPTKGEQNGEAGNGVQPQDGQKNKRPRLEEFANGDAPPPQPLPDGVNGLHDAKHEEEKMKVEHRNQQAEADVEAAQTNGAAGLGVANGNEATTKTTGEEEGSEEGEVEE